MTGLRDLQEKVRLIIKQEMPIHCTGCKKRGGLSVVIKFLMNLEHVSTKNLFLKDSRKTRGHENNVRKAIQE